MTIAIFVPRERAPGERRVALTPVFTDTLAKLGCELVVEQGAGVSAGFADTRYANVKLGEDAASEYARADVVLKVRAPERAAIERMKAGAIVVAFLNPGADVEVTAALLEHNISAFAVELIPRISRAQSMDALSSQASAAGYKAALIAALKLGRFFPMLTTAAGTMRPARVLVIGAGVAGLQAIATARRLGAMVHAYDVRAAAREQVESIGAQFVETGVAAEAAGGYARELKDEEKNAQQQALAEHIAKADALITTAALPGRAAPKIVSRQMVEAMKPGAVIVDLAAESGGNCALTRPGEDVEHGGVLITAPLNVPSLIAEHASEMYARNVVNFLKPAIKDGALTIDWEDEVYAQSVLTHAGEIRHAPTRERLGKEV